MLEEFLLLQQSFAALANVKWWIPLTITSLSSMSSAVKWYWGNWTEILSPSIDTGA